MTVVGLKKRIEAVPPPWLTIVFGAEEFLVTEAATDIWATMLNFDTAGLSSSIINGKEISFDEFVDQASAIPMMADRRVIWIKDADMISTTAVKGKKRSTVGASFAENPPPTALILLSGTFSMAEGIASGRATKSKRVLKHPWDALFGVAAVLEYPRLRESQLTVWTRERAKSIGLKIDEAAIELLLATTNPDLRQIDTELEKVLTFVNTPNATQHHSAVTVEVISALTGMSRSHNVFELQKVVGQRNRMKALEIASHMVVNDRQDVLIVTMLGRYFLSLFRLADARRSGSGTNIAAAAGIPPFALAEHSEALDRFSSQELESALLSLAKADLALKSSEKPLTVIQQLIAGIT